VFDGEGDAPPQLRRAAGSVKDYFRDLHQATGAVTINIQDGNIEEVVVVDTGKLEAVDAALTKSLGLDLDEIVENALEETTKELKKENKVVKAAKKAARKITGGLDPAKAKKPDGNY